jgi:hypothetical protein
MSLHEGLTAGSFGLGFGVIKETKSVEYGAKLPYRAIAYHDPDPQTSPESGSRLAHPKSGVLTVMAG